MIDKPESEVRSLKSGVQSLSPKSKIGFQISNLNPTEAVIIIFVLVLQIQVAFIFVVYIINILSSNWVWDFGIE